MFNGIVTICKYKLYGIFVILTSLILYHLFCWCLHELSPAVQEKGKHWQKSGYCEGVLLLTAINMANNRIFKKEYLKGY